MPNSIPPPRFHRAASYYRSMIAAIVTHSREQGTPLPTGADFEAQARAAVEGWDAVVRTLRRARRFSQLAHGYGRMLRFQARSLSQFEWYERQRQAARMRRPRIGG